MFRLPRPFRPVVRGLSLFAALAAPLALHGQATLVDDAFTRASRTTVAPPDGAAWLSSGSNITYTPGTAPENGTLVQAVGAAARMVTGYYTTAGSYASLAVGQELRLQFTFSLQGPLGDSAANFRIGLFNSTGQRVTRDNLGLGADTFIPYAGYAVTFNVGGTTSGISIRRRDPGAANNNLLNQNAAFYAAPLTADGTAGGAVRGDSLALTPDVRYLGTLRLLRTQEDALRIEFSVAAASAPDVPLESFAALDLGAAGLAAAPIATLFDAVAFNATSNSMTSFTLHGATVTTTGELTGSPDADPLDAQLRAARPGDVILVSGVHRGPFQTYVAGTAEAPITIRGDGTAVLQGDNTGFGLRINHDHYRIENLVIKNYWKALYLFNAKHGIAKNVHAMDVQQEAFKVKRYSQRWLFLDCSARRTGQMKDFGEGFYVGDADNNWETPTSPDTSGWVTFFNCYATDGVNDGYDAKEGSHDIKYINCTADYSGTIEPKKGASHGDSGFFGRADRVQYINCKVNDLNNTTAAFTTIRMSAASDGNRYGGDYELKRTRVENTTSLIYITSSTIPVKLYDDYSTSNVTNLYDPAGSTTNILVPAANFVELTWDGPGGQPLGHILPHDGATGDPYLAYLAADGFTADPVFTPAAGAYGLQQEITLACATPGAAIRYTTDGSTPTPVTGTLYTAPIALTGDVTLRALAYAPGKLDSAVVVAAFTAGAPAAPQIVTAPASLTVNAGAPATFTVFALGSAPLTYQWHRNGSAIEGATAATYTRFPVTPEDDASAYTVTVANAQGSVTSAPAAVLGVSTTPAAPVILAPPAGTTVTAGDAVTFTVVATGYPLPTYTWRRGDTVLADQTSATLHLSAVTPADAGDYSVTVANTEGTVTSAPATLVVEVIVPPAIATPPAAAIVTSGANLTLSVVATGSAPLTYQWFKDGVALDGATAATLTLTQVTSADAGAYHVVVTNAGGSAASPPAQVDVRRPLGQLTPLLSDRFRAASAAALAPPDAGAYFGSSGTLTYTAGDAGAGTNGSLQFNASRTIIGYLTQPTGAAGAPTFGPVTLEVGQKLVVQLTLACNGLATASFADGFRLGLFDSSTGTRLAGNLANSASDNAIKAYQGYFAAVNLTSAAGDAAAPVLFVKHGTNASSAALLSNLSGNGYTQLGRAGTPGAALTSTVAYHVSLEVARTAATAVALTLRIEAADGSGTILQEALLSDPMGAYTKFDTLGVHSVSGSLTSINVRQIDLGVGSALLADAPEILAGPVAQQVAAGATVTFGVTAGGTPPFTYQWSLDGAAIPGATESTLTLGPVTALHAGVYRVTVGNEAGAVTSAPAQLTVRDGFATWIAARAPAGATGATDDPDADGLANLLEYALGTDPAGADAHRLPSFTSEGGNYVFRFTRPAGRADLSYFVEQSADLAAWSDVPVTPAVSPGAPGEEIVTVTLPAPASAHWFIRLRVAPATAP